MTVMQNCDAIPPGIRRLLLMGKLVPGVLQLLHPLFLCALAYPRMAAGLASWRTAAGARHAGCHRALSPVAPTGLQAPGFLCKPSLRAQGC